MELLKAIVIVGPTASGKTALGVALARAFNGAIVSADSRQVYRGMDIGTGKAGSELGIMNHELGTTQRYGDALVQYCVDLVNPDELYTLSDYQRNAKAAMEEIWGQGMLPIIVGGTGLYVRALVDHLDIPSVAPDTAIRAELEGRLTREGLPALVAELRTADPASAAT
jgi:tRNA dimethylallyltransferase